jgi:hypothetical protein
MYHGAHWRCEPARVERINVEDPASTEDLVPQAVGQKLLITRSSTLNGTPSPPMPARVTCDATVT